MGRDPGVNNEQILKLGLSCSIPMFKWDVKLQFFFNYTWLCHHNAVNYLKVSTAYVPLVGSGKWGCLAIRPHVLLLDS